MNDTLIFECDGGEHELALTDEFAPRTMAGLRASVPTEITVHCAKIAGSHIYWPTAILAPLEKGADIHSMPAGSFLYYPDRQYLEIIYDELQAETAAVNVLGRFEGDLDWLRAFAERQRRRQGAEVFTARLFFPGERDWPQRPEEPAASAALERLRLARRDAWSAQPQELRDLLQRDGLNIPFGPLITAEGEFRRTQELLWRLWNNANGHDEATRATIAREVVELAIARVVGYCHLCEAGRALQDGIDALDDGTAPVEAVLGELVVYCGRMGAWLDLHIPWWEANEIARRNLGRA